MENYYEYYKFNKEVYDQFFAPNIGSNYHAAVIFSEITVVEDFSEFKGACEYLGKYPWRNLIDNENILIPRYLGLIAIQIYALSLRMSEEHPRAAYNPVLSELLKISDQRLQNLYSDAQADVFTAFENWCKKNKIRVEYLTKNGNYLKYVRYPLSFPVLHKGNCDSLKNIFAKEKLPVNGDYEFDDFCNLTPISEIFPALSKKDDFSQALWLQIYLFYKNWDGTYIEKNSPQKKTAAKTDSEQDQYYLEWDQEIKLFPEDKLFIKLLDKYEKKGCFFIKSPYNLEYHFIDSQDIDLSAGDDEPDYYLYIYKDSTKISDKLSRCNLQYPPPSLSDIPEYSCHLLTSGEIKEHLEDCLYDIKIYLRRGIKIKPWSRMWLEGAGPVIELPKNSEISKVTLIHCFADAKTETFDISEHRLINLPCGDYKLRYSPEPDDIIDFEICNVEKYRSQFSCKGGWKLDKKHLQVAEENDDIHICGLNFYKIPAELLERDQHKPGNPCRIWMDLAATGKSPEYSNDNLIHKSLRRAKNGLHIR